MNQGKVHRSFLVAGALCILSMLTATMVNSIGIFYLPVTQEFGISFTQMSLAITVFNLTYTVSMPLITKIINKYDLRLVSLICIVATALSFVIRALSNSIIGFYISAVLQGDAYIILINLFGPIIANNWFKKGVATVIGITSLFANIGGFIFNSVGAYVIDAYGWRACYWLWVAIVLVFGIPVSFLVRRTPEELGLQPYGFASGKDESIGDAIKKLGISAKAALKTPAFWLIGIAMACDCFGDNYSTYISPYAQILGMTAVTGGVMSSCVQFGGMGSKLLLGPICDKWPKAGAILSNGAGFLAFAAFLVFGKMGSVSVIAYAVICVIYGCAYSASNIGFSSLSVETFGPRDFGAIWPSLNIFIGVFGVISSVIYGRVIDTKGFVAAQGLGLSVYFIATLACVLVVLSNKKYKARWTEES